MGFLSTSFNRVEGNMAIDQSTTCRCSMSPRAVVSGSDATTLLLCRRRIV